MPINIFDLDNGIGCNIVANGIVEDLEYVSALKKHLSQNPNKLQKYTYTITDFSAVEDVEISTESIKLVAELCKDITKFLPETLVALVAEEDFMFGLSRMWEMWADETNWEIQVFREKNSAIDWLKYRINEKFGIRNLTFK